MTPRVEPTAERGRPLSRERVLAAALRLADAGGVESLSMRKLGQELGVQAMSLYNHVANKDEILDGMLELVMEEIELANGPDWKTAIRRSAISAHEAFMRHRWACSLMMSATAVSPARIRWTDEVLRALREAGFSPDLTHHAYHALDSHITGFTLWQVSLPFETREELVEMAEAFLREFPIHDYPYALEHIQQHLDPASPSGAVEFEFGLDLILDGIERMRDSGA